MRPEVRSIIVIAAFAILAAAFVILVQATSPSVNFEAEVDSSANVVSDNTASGNEFIEFTGGGGSGDLPDPISPSSNNFNEIIDDYRNGGVIVIPNGSYTARDLDGFNPSSRLHVVAEDIGQVEVIRRGESFGQTDFTIQDSSNISFYGIHFKEITTYLNKTSDLNFVYTTFSYPVDASPDPTQTVCGAQRDPTAVQVDRSENTNFRGVTIDGFGHDGFKMSRSNNTTIIGSVVTGGDHKGLQQGRGNSSCGWDGDDNYHVDAIQVFPGGIDGFVVEQSYFGHNTILQVDNGGTTNTNIVFRNNWWFQEPPRTSCIAANMRVKDGAVAGATMDVVFEDNVAWCTRSDWTFFVGGSRNNAMTINGDPISSSKRNASEYFDNRVGTPNIEDSPAFDWRGQNSYQSFLNQL